MVSYWWYVIVGIDISRVLFRRLNIMSTNDEIPLKFDAYTCNQDRKRSTDYTSLECRLWPYTWAPFTNMY